MKSIEDILDKYIKSDQWYGTRVEEYDAILAMKEYALEVVKEIEQNPEKYLGLYYRGLKVNDLNDYKPILDIIPVCKSEVLQELKNKING
jgi:hypothetical protein